MDKQNHKHEWFISSESFNIKDSKHNSRVADFVDRAHSIWVLHLIAGAFQVFLGLAVITVCVMGLLQPVWLSTALIMIASVTTMIGTYLLYITAMKIKDHNSLLRNAMRRVLESRN